MRPVPAAALDLIRRFEGLRLDPYHDCVGFPTVGYGHLLSRQRGAELSVWPSVSADEAEALLAADASAAARGVSRLIDAALTDGQYGALIDFVFNLGAGQLQCSTLRRVINRGDLDEAPAQFARWVYAGGQRLRGLVSRRAADCELWLA